MQLAKIENLSVDEIKHSIGDEQNNSIVEITGVDNARVQEMSDVDSIMDDEPSADMKYKRFYKLIPYKKLVGNQWQRC